MKYVQYLSHRYYSSLTLDKKLGVERTNLLLDSQDIEPFQSDLDYDGIDFKITGIIYSWRKSIFSCDFGDARIFVTDSPAPYLLTAVYREWIRYFKD